LTALILSGTYHRLIDLLTSIFIDFVSVVSARLMVGKTKDINLVIIDYFYGVMIRPRL